MRLSARIGWALAGGLALATLELLTILSQAGTPRPTALGVLYLITWLGVPYGLFMGIAAWLVEMLASKIWPRLSRRAAFVGALAGMCQAIWLRPFVNLRENGLTRRPLELLLALCAVASGVAVGFLVSRLKRPSGHGRALRIAGAAGVVLCLAWVVASGRDFVQLLKGDPDPVEDASPADEQPGNALPNVILISVDTLRADHVSSYGYDKPTTPSIDALAARGIRFAHAASTAAFTVPTHASMMTGLYPSSHGATYQYDDPSSFVIRGMSPETPTLAEILSRHGYETAGFVSCSLVGRQFGFARGFSVYDDRFDRLQRARAQLFARSLLFRGLEQYGVFKPEDLDGERHASEVNPLVEDWLRGRAAPNQSFFLFVHYYDAHAPYAPPPEYARRGDGSPIEAIYQGNLLLHGAYTLTPEALDDTLALYDGEIRYVDDHVGRLMKLLETSGALRNAIVILTSDHGESFGEHDHWAHTRVLYEDVVRVPFIMQLPQGRGAGSVITDAIAQPTDILPTVLSTVGLAVPREVQGKDLTALLDPGRSRPRAPSRAASTAFSEQMHDADSARRFGSRYEADLQAVRTLRWKYIFSSKGPEELYDLTADPAECTNLAGLKPGELLSMRELMGIWRRSIGAPIETHAREEIDPATIENLRSLGYIE